MRQPQFIAETQTVRRLASDPNCRWVWTSHFFEESANEDPPVTQPDIAEVLRNGKVIYEEHKKDVLWRVKGKDLDQRSIICVIAVFAHAKKIKVVTVWSESR